MRKLSTIVLALTSLSALALVGCAGTATGQAGSASAPMTMAEYEAKMGNIESRAMTMAKDMNTKMAESMKGANPMDPAAMKVAMPKMAPIAKQFREGLGKLVDEMKAINPPAELKEFHELQGKQADSELKDADAMIAAMEKGDMTALSKMSMDAAARQAKQQEEIDAALKKAGFDPAKYHTDKKFVKLAK